MSIKIMIIEDDLIIAENLKENLKDLQYNPIGIATEYNEAVNIFKEQKPDLCLVDIYLKGSAKNGIEIMRELVPHNEVPIIYLTSFDDTEFREKSKDTNPSAYLIKPASKKQIDVAIDFAITNFNKQKYSNPKMGSNSFCPFSIEAEYFYIKTESRYKKILFNNIIYLQASRSYCQIITLNNEYIVTTSLSSFLQQFSNKRFIRCHRSYAVNIDLIESFDDNSLFLLKGNEILDIPISNSYKNEIFVALPRIKSE